METITQALQNRRTQETAVSSRPRISQGVSVSVGTSESASSNPLSVFRNQPPATATEVMPLVYRLAVNFPAMGSTIQVGSERISFWTVLGEQLVQLGWSRQRIEYACNQLLRNCPYREFRVAEFLNIDSQVHEITNAEFSAIERSRAPHKPIVSTQIDGKWRLLYQEDAERIGLTDYQRRYTTWEVEQMTPEERKQKGIYWMD